METTSAKAVHCVVVTPERTVLETTADFVAVPLYDGELGVLPGRAAFIGRLGPGELRTRQGADVKRFFVDGGFAQVRDNVVTVLTPRAIRAEDIDKQAAFAVVNIPADQAGTGESGLRDKERARIQLRIANKSSGNEQAQGH